MRRAGEKLMRLPGVLKLTAGVAAALLILSVFRFWVVVLAGHRGEELVGGAYSVGKWTANGMCLYVEDVATEGRTLVVNPGPHVGIAKSVQLSVTPGSWLSVQYRGWSVKGAWYSWVALEWWNGNSWVLGEKWYLATQHFGYSWAVAVPSDATSVRLVLCAYPGDKVYLRWSTVSGEELFGEAF